MSPELVVLVQEDAAQKFAEFAERVPVGGPPNVFITTKEREVIAIVADAIRQARWVELRSRSKA